MSNIVKQISIFPLQDDEEEEDEKTSNSQHTSHKPQGKKFKHKKQTEYKIKDKSMQNLLSQVTGNPNKKHKKFKKT